MYLRIWKNKLFTPFSTPLPYLKSSDAWQLEHHESRREFAAAAAERETILNRPRISGIEGLHIAGAVLKSGA